MTGERVLHVITGIDVGGAESHLLSLCEGLVAAGHRVTVAYLKGDGELAEEFRAVGCDVVHVGIGADADPLGFLSLLDHVCSGEYDIVHGHLFHGNVYGVTAAALTGVETIVSSKHNDPPFWSEQPYATIHDLTLGRTDAVVTISDHVRRYLLEETSVDPGKVRTVRYGMSTEEFEAVDEGTVASVREEFVDEGQGPLVGTVARLSEQKDLPTLLRAFERVRDRHPEAHLAVVGRGEREAALKSLADDLGLSEAVTFAGFRSDVPALMHAFDVFALPSRWEGFGMVFLEAMAAGTPVVASNTSAIPEVVADGETGVLCEPGDIEVFADAIGGLLADDGRRAWMCERCRERMRTEFSERRMVDEVLDVYDGLR